MKDKRNLTIADDSNTSVSVTLWGEFCRQNNFVIGDIIAFNHVRVSDYGGKTLNTQAGSNVILEPKTEACTKVQKWYSSLSKDAIQKLESLSGGQAEGGISQRIDNSITIQEMI